MKNKSGRSTFGGVKKMDNRFKASTGDTLIAFSTGTSTASVMDVQRPAGRRAPAATQRGQQKNVENAVYAHIQAVRSLGRTRINTSDIARALSIPQNAVVGALAALQKKGVRVAE